jgi:EmrB/QacA subfamily drug resistance transporter
MDSTIVSVILPQLQTAFHTDFQTISWVASAYFLAEAAALPIIGYVSDHIGTKRAFLTALAVFIAGSLLCALSPTKEALIAFRVLQGIGGGALLPMSMTINYRNFPPHERSKVSAILGIPLVIAPTIAPTIGGYLSTSLNWNAVFLINVPIGIIDLLLAFLILPGRTSNQNEQVKGARKSFDIVGLVLSLVGVTTLVYGISEAGAQGWGDQTVLTALLIGAAILIVFIVVELQVSNPVLDLRLYLNYPFAIANILMWLIVGVFTGSLLLLPFFFENVRGDTALTTGMFLIVPGLASAVGINTAGNLYNRVGPRILVVGGLLLLAGGTYGLTQINVHTTGLDLQVWLLLRGLGIGLVIQPLNTLALSVVSNQGMAKASSLVTVTRQVTTATAVAALTTYLTVQTATYGVGPQALAAGIADTFWVILILGLVCIPPALFLGRDPTIEAMKRAQQAKVSETLSTGQVQEGRGERLTEHLLAPQSRIVPTAPMVQIKNIPNVISTLSANGEQIMGPEILLWRYPLDSVVNGSLLIVESNQFCILKSQGVVLDVYETGQYTVPTSPLYDSVQLAFSGEPISWQYEALYINRAKLMGKASGVVPTREMAVVDYHVYYSIHVATREDAVNLVKHMPYRSHTLSMQEVSTYAGPVIEEAVNQLVLITPLGQTQGLHMRRDISQLVYQRLQSFLYHYGMTLDMVKVQGLTPRGEHMEASISLKASGLSELDAVRYSTAMTKHSMDRLVTEEDWQ